jgi:hypothetical protein
MGKIYYTPMSAPVLISMSRVQKLRCVLVLPDGTSWAFEDYDTTKQAKQLDEEIASKFFDIYKLMPNMGDEDKLCIFHTRAGKPSENKIFVKMARSMPSRIDATFSEEKAERSGRAKKIWKTLHEPFGFGKHAKLTVKQVIDQHPGYIEWALQNISPNLLDDEANEYYNLRTRKH